MGDDFVPTPKIQYTRFTEESQIISSPNLNFRVYYLEAPISILGKDTPKSLSENLVSLQFFHVGLGFQSTDPSAPLEFTLDYELVTGFTLDALLPEIVGEGDNKELVWKNQTEVLIGSFIDRNYWLNSEYVCEIPNSVLVGLQRWTLNTWNPDNPNYSLFSAVVPSEDDPSKPSRETLFNPFMRSSTCNDYCYAAFDYLIDNQVCIEYVTPPKNNVNAFVLPRDKGEIVDYDTFKFLIIEFYEQLEEEINNIEGLLEQIEQVIQEIENAPPEDIPALLVELIELVVQVIIQLALAYANFQFVYYYGYADDTSGEIVYWRFEQPSTFINYIEGNLYRSYAATTINNVKVIDGYTKPGQNCTQFVPDPLIETTAFQANTDLWFWVSGLVLLVLFLIIIGFILVSRKKR